MKRMYRTDLHVAHHIAGHPTCGKTHGHTFHLEVTVEHDKFVDFHEIGEKVGSIVVMYDHGDLGDMTCEDLARILLTRLVGKFPKASLVEVELWETPRYGVKIDHRNYTTEVK